MRNTLYINHLNSGSVDLVKRLNSGTNEFLLEVVGGNGATITFDGGSPESVTSDDFIFEVDSELWVGAGVLTINISDGNISYSLTVNKVDQQLGDIYIQQDSETEFTFVKKQDSKRELLDFFYRVGTYYETSDPTFDPNVEWGGTWELEAEGLVHISAGENFGVSDDDQDGGSAQITYTPAGTVENHTLTAAESGVPAHTHDGSTGGGVTSFLRVVAGTPATFTEANHIAGRGSGSYKDVSNTSNFPGGSHYHNFTTNNNTAKNATSGHNHDFTGTQATLDNMQPYKIVNRWHRVA